METKLGKGTVNYSEKEMALGRIILPTFDKVLVRKDEAPSKIGVIVIPPSYRDMQKLAVVTGTVVATGPEVEYVTPGMYVVVSQYSGSQVKVDGVEYTVLREQDVHVIITETGSAGRS